MEDTLDDWTLCDTISEDTISEDTISVHHGLVGEDDELVDEAWTVCRGRGSELPGQAFSETPAKFVGANSENSSCVPNSDNEFSAPSGKLTAAPTSQPSRSEPSLSVAWDGYGCDPASAAIVLLPMVVEALFQLRVTLAGNTKCPNVSKVAFQPSAVRDLAIYSSSRAFADWQWQAKLHCPGKIFTTGA